ncbi:MAG: DUF1292 domain-containing protein [Slackia sp.]|nr:DUF1292 domain-containing protein [Slackia sp.]
MAEIREGSAPNFAPPVQEGIVFEFEDEHGDIEQLEFLGLILHNDRRYGFFFPVDDESPAGSSGEVLILEVTELDEEGQPAAFELLMDEGIAQEVYDDFVEATKDIYRFV